MHRLKSFLPAVFALCVGLFASPRAHAAYYATRPYGEIKGTALIWVNSTTIKLAPGYGEINGNYWEVTPSDPLVTTGYALSGLTSTATGVYQYIYISSASSTLPLITLRNSTTAPTRDATKLGWYDGNDRCIGVVWILPSGALSQFLTVDEETYLCAPALIVSGGPVSTTYPGSLAAMNLTSSSQYLPVNVKRARMEISCDMGANNVLAEVHIISDDGTYLSKLPTSGYRKAIVGGWVDIARTASRNFRWFAYSSISNNSVNIWINGYQIER